MCAKNFDKIVIKEDKDKRGRKNGEIAELINDSILRFNRNAKCSIRLDEVEALEHAIKISNKDDIIVVFYEKLNPLLDFINDRQSINDLGTLVGNCKQYI